MILQLIRCFFGFKFLILPLGFLIASEKQCAKCPDDYKVKTMPSVQPYFKPDGSGCYQLKTYPPIWPYFKPQGCDDYKIKTLPKVIASDKGVCEPDGGTGVNFFGLRPRPETRKKISQP